MSKSLEYLNCTLPYTLRLQKDMNFNAKKEIPLSGSPEFGLATGFQKCLIGLNARNEPI